jgi:hypothetical protein
VLVFTIHNFRRGVVFAIKWSPWAKPIFINRFASILRLGMGRAQDATEFSPQLQLHPGAGYASEGILAR